MLKLSRLFILVFALLSSVGADAADISGVEMRAAPVLVAEGKSAAVAAPSGAEQATSRGVAGGESRNLVVSNKASAGRRIALVIGNGDYQNPDSLPKLANPAHDAADIATALRHFGFDVIEKENLGKQEMDEAITEFSRKIGNSDAALFYFAGHGIQVKGQNFLIPVDASIRTDAEVQYVSVNLNRILDEMDYAGSKANIVILDACRNNPISGKFRSGATRGLAAPSSTPKGTVIVYATDPGNTAMDGNGRNGLFTSGLLEAFQGGDLSLHGVLARTSKVVEQMSEGRQTPYVNGPMTLQDEFHFALGTQVTNQESLPVHYRTQEEIERDTWFMARDSRSEAGIAEYLNQYPQGRYVAEARVLLATLRDEAHQESQVATISHGAGHEDPQAALWGEVQKGNSETDYQAYLEQYPKGKFAGLARSRIKQLHKEAEAEKSRAENDAWHRADSEGTEDSYAGYLANYPRGQFHKLAKARIEKLSRSKAQAGTRGQQEFEKGRQYENGIGVQLNNDEAYSWYRKAAEDGNLGGAGAVAAFIINGWTDTADLSKAFEYAQKAANGGDGRGMNVLAICYQYGLGVEKNPEAALAWYRKSAATGFFRAKLVIAAFTKSGRLGMVKDSEEAERLFKSLRPLVADEARQGVVAAMEILGGIYQEGLGVEKNLEEAVRWYRKAIDVGSSEAAVRLAYMYIFGLGVERSPEEAFRLSKKAAERSSSAGMNMLGSMYLNGIGVEKNMEEAAIWFRKSAAESRKHPIDTTAMNRLAILYLNGLGVEKNPEEAVRWYRKSAGLEDGSAMVNLSYLYRTGLGVDKNPAESVRLLKKAVEMENAEAMGVLGYLYQNGIGVEKSPEEAVRWYRKGAVAGDGNAMVNLGVMYEQGAGLERNYEEAVRWYRKGCDLGNAAAMSALANMYFNGKGIEKNHQEGVRWARKGAELGNTTAMANLGWAYEFGNGVEKDMTKAIEWYKKASAQGNEYATAQLKRLEQVK